MEEMIATFGDVKAEYKLKPAATRKGLYCIVNPDFQQVWDKNEYKNYKNVSRNTRNGIAYAEHVESYYGAPATARFLDDTPLVFKKEFQEWVHFTNHARSQQSEAASKSDFRFMFRDNAWMSNFAGTKTRADYINGNGLPPEIMKQPMATGGALLKIVGETVHRGAAAWLVEAINPNVSIAFTFAEFPHLYFPPTISCRLWTRDAKGNFISKEEFYSEPYPAYGENTIMPILGFRKDPRSITGYVNLIAKTRVYILPNDRPIPHPYVMRFGRTKPNPYD